VRTDHGGARQRRDAFTAARSRAAKTSAGAASGVVRGSFRVASTPGAEDTTPYAARMSNKVPLPQDLLRKATRRQEYSASTKKALVDVARRLFAERGYAGASLDEIVGGARVTKGALYHHFKGKQELFEAVFVAVETTAVERIRRAVRRSTDPWERAVSGLREFLAVTRDEEYRRVVIQDGPAVLGYERYREQEERSTFGLVQEIVASLLTGYDLTPSVVEAVTRLFFGAMAATGPAVSTAEDPEQASVDAERAIVLVLAGIRALLDSGAEPPGPAGLAEIPLGGPDGVSAGP
jgi:AcrR family transcriptional regulator